MTTDVQAPAESALVALPPSSNQAIFRGVVGLVLLAAGVGNQIASGGFPFNAPVEWFWNLFISVTLIASGVILLVFALLAWRRPSVPTRVGRFSPLVVAGVVLIGLTLVAWLLTGLPALFADGRLRYMNLTFGIAWAGSAWGTGMVMCAVGFRAWSKPSRVVAGVCLGIGVALAAFAVYVAALYSLALTD